MKKIFLVFLIGIFFIPNVKATGFVEIYSICQNGVGCKLYGMDAEEYNNGLYNQTSEFTLKYSSASSGTPNTLYELGINPSFMGWTITPGQRYVISFNVKTNGQDNNFYNWFDITGVRRSSEVNFFEVEKSAVSSTEVNYKISIIFSKVPYEDINFYLESKESAMHLDWFSTFVSYFTRPIVSNVENFTTEIQEGLDDIRKEQEKTNQQLGDLNNNITNDDVDTSGANSFFDGFSDTDHGGLSAVVTAPLTFVNKITGTCEPISFPVFEKTITLPCGDTLFWNKEEVSSFRTIWNLIFGGGILYGLLCMLFKTIDNLKNPDDSRIEVTKL